MRLLRSTAFCPRVQEHYESISPAIRAFQPGQILHQSTLCIQINKMAFRQNRLNFLSLVRFLQEILKKPLYLVTLFQLFILYIIVLKSCMNELFG